MVPIFGKLNYVLCNRSVIVLIGFIVQVQDSHHQKGSNNTVEETSYADSQQKALRIDQHLQVWHIAGQMFRYFKSV